jgi:hypothetical protein
MSTGAGAAFSVGDDEVEPVDVVERDPAVAGVDAAPLLEALEPQAPSEIAPARASTAMAAVRRRARATTELLFS